MTDQTEGFDLKQWKQSALLKAACTHLATQPEYARLPSDQRAELNRFGHALRRELREAKNRSEGGEANAIQQFCNTFGMSVLSMDNCRFGVTVFEYRMAIILDINLNGINNWAEQILFEPEY